MIEGKAVDSIAESLRRLESARADWFSPDRLILM
jgi:hypothetical protein